MNTIVSNSILTCRFVTDAELKVEMQVTARTKSTCTVTINGKSEKRKIYNNGESEYIYPYGKYSMAPIAKPAKTAKIIQLCN